MDHDIEFQDRLALLGTILGAFVIIVGLGTLLGMPWATNESLGAVIVQLLGIIATIGVGAVLIILSYSTEPSELLPV